MVHKKRCYVVHLFVASRLTTAPIETISAKLAALKARDWYRRTRDNLDAGEFVLNNEVSHYLVDLDGDPEHAQCETFESEENPLLSILRNFVDWFERKQNAREITQIVNDARQRLRNAI